MIDSKAVRLGDDKERGGGGGAAGAAAREKKEEGITRKLAPRTKSKGKEIEVISLEEELGVFICLG